MRLKLVRLKGRRIHLTDSVTSRKFWVAVALGCVAAWMGNHFGFWYLTFVVTVLLGVLFNRASVAMWGSLLTGLIGWCGPLLWQSFISPIGPAASMTAGVMGFGVSHGYLVLVLTIVIGVLLALSGGWLGSSGRSFMHPVARRRMYN